MTASLSPAAPVRDSAFRTSEILSALSCALDITEGQPPGHAVRTCLIGMRIAERAGVPVEDRGPLFYALLLKDLGCSSNAARLCSLFGADDRALKREHKLTDWSRKGPSLAYALRHAVPDASPMGRVLRVASMAFSEKGSGREMTQTRCDRGAEIASMLGFTEATRQAIRTIDEHWDGNGMPEGLSGTAIPLLGRIVGLAQSVEIFASTFGVDAAIAVAMERRGRWFDPTLVDALKSVAREEEFWGRVLGRSPEQHLGALEPADQVLLADESRLDDIAHAFARVIDAKSPYTYLHSERVAELAVTIGKRLALRRRRDPGPAPRRPAARHRQARRLDLHPRQARPAHRARAGRDPGAPGLHSADSGAGGRLRRDRDDRGLAPRAAGRQGLPSRTDRATGCRR